MKSRMIFLLVVCLCGSVYADLPSIFSGKDLDGWKVPENNIWWKVEGGELNVQSGPKKTGQTLWTEKEYGNFVMQFEFKFGEGTVDTGIFLRDSKEQIQIGMSGSLKRDLTGSPYISGKGYPVEATPKFAMLDHKSLKPGTHDGVKDVLKPEGWNSMTIVAIGKNYTVFLNGRFVMSYDSESAKKKGPVGIQLHGGRDMSCAYRKMTLCEVK